MCDRVNIGTYPNYPKLTLFYGGKHRLAAKLHNKKKSLVYLSVHM